jgi:hypothetical protein
LTSRVALTVVSFLHASCGGLPGELVDPGAGSTIPPGSQVVHVAIDDGHVAISPDMVRSGSVYLVLDASPTGTAMLIGGAGPAVPDGGALPAGALDRLVRGDLQGTSTTSFGASGCSRDQRTAAQGRLGPCGNVSVFDMRAGQYAILGDAPETNATRRSPLPMGVLTVTP